MKSLSIENLAVTVGRKLVLKKVEASFCGGEFSAILGPNGAGKTTLLKAIMSIMPYKGKVSSRGRDGQAIPPKSFSYLCQLNKSSSQLTVIEVVLLGLVHQLSWNITSEQEQKAEAILNDLGLIHLATRQFSQLSGGQQQLVSLAQALVSEPDVLLLDEPTSALDLKHQVQVLDLARQYTRAKNTITIAVLHDLSLAARYCDHLLLLDDGVVQHSGKPDDVLDSEKLSRIYQVHVDVGCCIHGHTHVTPVRALETE
ncbi:putative ABC-type cobalamin/Fe3+-siderophores transport systems, ATPase component [Vibrio nigripulchritudo SOn1]|uniref:ABC-type cobalamin/Fe3+-siderophores transport systems, ATPase component n=1 Tax=Vibrio nigripulchritudo SOn1 TaxID=1238450 RepID=A0AAV2VTQ8_9VIBR|nr:ABC transporter ATP-binding protein [Vibrio nigripulchritudo]CCO48099.1 putative ABC-type cobalamin/Fe3+-siderophores transport systems, ATPase component [Vibrio nigripulchritudo SOn1]